MKNVEIITGKIKAGKTTYLKNRLKNYDNVQGILQPVINGERYFEDIKSKEKVQLSTQFESDDTFILGKYIFYKNAFRWAKFRLESILSQNSSDTIIIDEYGLLEFEGKGLEPTVSKILKRKDLQLIIVIRESLVEKFIDKFNLPREIIKITEIES